MQTKKGHKFELDLVRDINKYAPDSVCAVPMGFSGNHWGSQADVLVTTNCGNHVIEAKTTAVDTGFHVDSEDIDQLEECVNSNTIVWTLMNCSYREACMVYTADWLSVRDGVDPRDMLLEFTPECFNPRIGKKSGDYIIDKPSTTEWPSQQAGKDAWEVVCEAIGVDVESTVDSTEDDAFTRIDIEA